MNKTLLTITEPAKKHLSKIGEPNVKLSVKGGGCAGFQYEWKKTDEEPTLENLVIDPLAEMYIFGCVIDFVEQLDGSFLVIKNPNATSSCGCGESFAV
jgi:iron-sulfur cluster insertion protein